jgi:hypothetical protein
MLVDASIVCLTGSMILMINTLSGRSKFPKQNRGLGVGRLHVSIAKHRPSHIARAFQLSGSVERRIQRSQEYFFQGFKCDRAWTDAQALVLL